METAKKLLLQNKPTAALERLKKLLPKVDAAAEWQVHEMIGAAFHDLAGAEGAAQAYFNAAKMKLQWAHFVN